MKVMTWNVLHGAKDVANGKEKALKVIRECGVDLVLMQESYHIAGSKQKLGSWLAEQLGWSSYQGGSAHLCVLSRWPIKEKYYHSQWHGVGVHVEIDNEKSFVAYSFWLNSSSYTPYALKKNPGETDKDLLDCETERLRNMNSILTYMANKGHLSANVPVLLGGDGNCPSHLDWTVETARNNKYRRALPLPVSLRVHEMGFSDTFRAIHPDPVAVPGNTWSPLVRIAKDGREEPQDRIDYLHTKNPADGRTLKPLRAWILPEVLEDNDIPLSRREFPSDHCALVVEFAWSES